MKVVQYFKHARNLNAYKKKYKRLTHALLCVFVLCAAFVLTTYAGAETHNLENYTYVSYSQSSDLDDEETLQLLTIDESTHPVYVLQKNNIASVKVSTNKNSDGIENGTITPDTKYLKLKVEFQNIHADTLEKINMVVLLPITYLNSSVLQVLQKDQSLIRIINRLVKFM